MTIKKLSFRTSAVFFLVSAAMLLSISTVYAKEICNIIKIDAVSSEVGSQLDIFPKNITVPVGSCTIWYNSSNKKVHVSFRENAKQCMLSTESPSGFTFSESKINPNDPKDGGSCYISHELARGSTASLYWNKPGTYKYALESPLHAHSGDEFSGERKMVEGVIVVK